MERVWTTDLSEHVGERVRLAGWLHRLRDLKSVNFLIIRDAKGLAQVTIEDMELAGRLRQLHNESVLIVEGTVAAEPQAPGGLEVHQPTIEVLSPSVSPPPFDLFRPDLKAQLPTILDHAPLALRHPNRRILFRVAAASLEGFRSVLRSLEFVEIHTPKIVGSATESGANVFAIDYFGRPAFLAQSPQLYKQIMVGVFERVFEVGPVFRAEPHDTPRHLNEYVSLDAEMGFIGDYTMIMTILTQVLYGMVNMVREEIGREGTSLGIALPEVPSSIPIIHFRDAQDLIARETEEEPRGEPDLAPAHEKWLGQWARQQLGSDFLFVVGYPMEKRPFYTHPDASQPGFSNSFDLLFRGLELVTGGQRLHSYEDYLDALAARGIDNEPLAGYLEAFKYGMPPHGGFAIGLERWVAQLANVSNIRESALFPRDLHRLAP